MRDVSILSSAILLIQSLICSHLRDNERHFDKEEKGYSRIEKPFLEEVVDIYSF
jgi:hypothetical protein